MKHAWIPLAAALVLSGCAKNIDNKEAVQASVRKYVSGKGINVSQMDVNVNSVSFHGAQADASVAFVPKGGGGGVAADYQLERVKDEWMVKSRSGMNTLDHTKGSELPGEQGAAGLPGSQATPGAAGRASPHGGNPDGTIGSKP